MTVKELKEILATWSEEDVEGEDTEVWVMLENDRSKLVHYVTPLNLRRDDNGILKADMLIETEEFEVDVTVEDMKLGSY